jgi:hypothetical protein
MGFPCRQRFPGDNLREEILPFRLTLSALPSILRSRRQQRHAGVRQQGFPENTRR